jgi:hypothetical protein
VLLREVAEMDEPALQTALSGSSARPRRKGYRHPTQATYRFKHALI